jgi:hypothetical protein
MRRPAPRPKVNFYVQVAPEISELRLRLQDRSGLSSAELVSKALRSFEHSLGLAANHDLETPKETTA